MNIVHFGSFDPRFCGSCEKPRKFATDPNEVTCPTCQGNDRFVLSPSGVEALRAIAAAEGGVS